MKMLSLSCVLLSLCVVGCGKKAVKEKKATVKSRKFAKNDLDIPLLDQEDNHLNNGPINEFAFVDDEAPTNFTKTAEIPTNFTKTAKVDTSEDTIKMLTVDEAPKTVALDEAETYAFQAVHFDLNKNAIRADQRAMVVEDAKLAQKTTADGKEVVIQGHCCQLGSHSYNMALSQRRAEAVKLEMVKNGIAPEKIKTVGYGNEMPLVWSDKKDHATLVKDLAPNRRAEFVVN